MNAGRRVAGAGYVPPPVYFGGLFLLGLVLQWLVPAGVPGAGALGAAYTTVGWGLALGGACLAAWAIATVKLRQTSGNIYKAPSLLVKTGPFALSRNPMYLSLALLYLGLVLIFDLGWALIGWPIAIAATTFLVIRPEEAWLEDLFGQDYRDYKARVRRWI